MQTAFTHFQEAVPQEQRVHNQRLSSVKKLGCQIAKECMQSDL